MDSIPAFGAAGPPIKPDPEENTSTSPDPGQVSAHPDAGVDEPKAHALHTNYLQQLISLTDPELLEKGVAAGVKLLSNLKETLEVFVSAEGTEAARWIKAVDELCARPRVGRTVVGVVGNTGAGKSSVINALLDEERLLPTSCLRACTASATEVSYNHSDDPAQLYRAEIEFITFQDWLKELDGLFDDLIDGSGRVSRESSSADTDAGRAYAKIKAVYPRLTKEMIEQTSPESLANENAVRHVLGSVKKFQATAAPTMYRQLQNYVDSKEKTAATGQTMEFWPLIKVVRIYTKATALSTGAVIVDLPGVQDSNAARAAVAANYMKQCSGLWIVAPITRAVDDKTAKKLLGEQFKRQLKYDGTYSSVTFICSKTDDISITEAADSLGLDDELGDDWADIERINDTSKQLAQRIKDLKDQKAAFGEMLNQVEDEEELWEDLDRALGDGRTVYAPTADGGKKRKRQSKPSGSRKDRLSTDTDSDSDSEDSALSDSESLSGSDKENGNNRKTDGRVPLTEEQIDVKLESLKAQKKSLRQNRKEADAKILDLRREIKEMHVEKERIESKIKSMCIKGRNAYSRGAIKQDFASGIKDLDQETAMELDEANFDPEQDLRDYGKVAESLPVFCVSSRAYQQLRGRLKKDNFSNDGFKSVEDTEVPQLQEHARKMTEAGRALNSRVLLNDMSQLLNSMKLWADNDGTSQLTKADKRGEQARLTEHLALLDKNLQQCVQECVNSLKEELADNIFDAFGRAIPLAQAAALPTSSSWASQMRWSTYKATVKRNGVWSGAAGPHDFQQELWAPIATHLAGGWERAFQRRLPRVLEAFVVKATNMLDNFHKDAISYAREHFVNLSGVNMLDRQLSTYKSRIKEIPAIIAAIIQEIQRDANRSFEPIIEGDMQPAYAICTQEQGAGQYMRMKTHMHNHVDKTRHTMFNHAADTVRAQLEAMCDKICQELWNQVLQNIFKHLSRDYLSVLGTADAKAVSTVTRAERMLRGELSLMLAQDADLVFKDCLTGAQAPAVQQPTLEQPASEEPGVKGESADEQAGDESDAVTAGRHESLDLGFPQIDSLQDRASEDS
ncbi:hypothetical protein CONLIGDRAFT_578624 [Coniochaeta ligniaria NRRL 30616]|uniref:Tat pathway signal sequence n=1 Tax=Coniochaeta ligniaria NRRL 30616 TaxID=1408157 RepID=A0A1J7J5B5_9PEZI|nr:hypothetical protein CONLIGDRAFT_578624 [Coniochaeta ligniaria NRRL 30616]